MENMREESERVFCVLCVIVSLLFKRRRGNFLKDFVNVLWMWLWEYRFNVYFLEVEK